MDNLWIWLVVEPYPSEKYDIVNWDDELLNIWEHRIHVPVTTNQHRVSKDESWISPGYLNGNPMVKLFFAIPMLFDLHHWECLYIYMLIIQCSYSYFL